jgi:hypothetical protein
MTQEREKGEVSYGRPPKHSQWKKGQCGNPSRRYKRTPKGVGEIIDRWFEDQIDVVENGVSRRVTVFEAILLQLLMKEMSGDKSAMRVRLKYQEFAANEAGPDRPRQIIIEHLAIGDESGSTRAPENGAQDNERV